ncbi:MAG: outer membrane beta-barrel protein [Saprospiraceae bacterium]
MRVFTKLTLMLFVLSLVSQLSAQTSEKTTAKEDNIVAMVNHNDKEKAKVAEKTTEPVTAVEEEEEEPKFTISGSADTYFRTNLNGPNDISKSGIIAPATSFANLPGFSLGMINLVGAYETAKGGVVADLVFGPRGSDAVFGSPLYSNSGQMVNQLYAYWNVSPNATITMGNFNTFLGYEVISPTANFNYSTSYMFSWGPFSHTGLKLDISSESGFSFMAGILNPTDITEFNPSGDYFVGLQAGYGGFYLNGLFGDGYSQVDLTGGVDVSESFYLGINATLTDTGDDTGFSGAAIYAQLAASDDFKIGARVELFQDKATVFGDFAKANASDFTLTGNYTTGNLTIIPEIRFDTNSEDVFVDKDGAPSSGLASFLLAFVYGF